jgi:hypothetical protein
MASSPVVALAYHHYRKEAWVVASLVAAAWACRNTDRNMTCCCWAVVGLLVSMAVDIVDADIGFGVGPLYYYYYSLLALV